MGVCISVKYGGQDQCLYYIGGGVERSSCVVLCGYHRCIAVLFWCLSIAGLKYNCWFVDCLLAVVGFCFLGCLLPVEGILLHGGLVL